MARFLLLSDIHREHSPFVFASQQEVGPIDAVLLGGDLDVGIGSLDFARAAWHAYGVPVLFVLGNHEYYHQVVETFEDNLRTGLAALQGQGMDIRWLQGDRCVIAGTRVIGATLWTDMELMGIPTSRFAAMRGVKDYATIRVRDARSYGIPSTRPLHAEDTIAWHHAQKARIFAHLDEPFDGPTVVLTHHRPSEMALAPDVRNDPLNPAFASELAGLIVEGRADWWLSGHSHRPAAVDLDRTDGGVCRLRSNTRGYPWEQARSGFDPTFVIDTGA